MRRGSYDPHPAAFSRFVRKYRDFSSARGVFYIWAEPVVAGICTKRSGLLHVICSAVAISKCPWRVARKTCRPLEILRSRLQVPDSSIEATLFARTASYCRLSSAARCRAACAFTMAPVRESVPKGTVSEPPGFVTITSSYDVAVSRMMSRTCVVVRSGK